MINGLMGSSGGGVLANYGGNLYTMNNPTMARLLGIGGQPQNSKMFDIGLKRATQMGYMTPYQMQPQPQQAPVQPAFNPQGPQAFQDKLNRLTINASDALYGGLLGYNPKPITSPTGNTYNPPAPDQNYNFRNFNFGLLNGMGGQ